MLPAPHTPLTLPPHTLAPTPPQDEEDLEAEEYMRAGYAAARGQKAGAGAGAGAPTSPPAATKPALEPSPFAGARKEAGGEAGGGAGAEGAGAAGGEPAPKPQLQVKIGGAEALTGGQLDTGERRGLGGLEPSTALQLLLRCMEGSLPFMLPRCRPRSAGHRRARPRRTRTPHPPRPACPPVFEEMHGVGSPGDLTPRAPLEHRFDRLYVVLISLHGLVRGERMELGRDSDTGGQVGRRAGGRCCWAGRVMGGQAWLAAEGV